MKAFLLPILFVAAAFFASLETAFFALRRTDILRWKEQGVTQASRMEKILSNPSRLITTIFLYTEALNVTISATIAALVVPLFASQRHGEMASLLVATLSILVVADIAPKSIVLPRAGSFSLAAIRPFTFFLRLASPVRFLVEGAANGILRLFGGRSVGADWGSLSEREFRALVDVVEEEGDLEEGERELIHNIFDLAERRAGEIMTPLADVFMVPATQGWEGLLSEVRRFRRSRIPVYGEGGRQDILGILHFKELLDGIAADAPPDDWLSLLAEPFAVPASIRLPVLLREFRIRKLHFALVADEYGDVAGIVTLEDVLEELFGEIREEHDREVAEIVPRPDGSFRVQGRTPVEHFNEYFSTSIPDEEWDTVAGFLLHEFGRLPARGDSVALGDLVMTVERLKGIRIVRIRVGKERRSAPRERQDEDGGAPPPGGGA